VFFDSFKEVLRRKHEKTETKRRDRERKKERKNK
jgi:hypothetical protein